MFEPEQRTYKEVTAEILVHQDYIAYPVLFPPVHFKVQQLSNRSLFYTETIHFLSWESNPQNNSSSIKKYRISYFACFRNIPQKETGIASERVKKLDFAKFDLIISSIYAP